MTSTPRHAITDLAADGQTGAGTIVNDGNRSLESGAAHFTVVNDTLTAPPGSEADGAQYIINGTPTGAWSTFADEDIVIAKGASAANGWLPITPWKGVTAYDQAGAHNLLFTTTWVVVGAVNDVADNTTGTDNAALADGTASYSQTIFNDNFASLKVQVQANTDALRLMGDAT